jgi:hypothetical protein
MSNNSLRKLRGGFYRLLEKFIKTKMQKHGFKKKRRRATPKE